MFAFLQGADTQYVEKCTPPHCLMYHSRFRQQEDLKLRPVPALPDHEDRLVAMKEAEDSAEPDRNVVLVLDLGGIIR